MMINTAQIWGRYIRLFGFLLLVNHPQQLYSLLRIKNRGNWNWCLDHSVEMCTNIFLTCPKWGKLQVIQPLNLHFWQIVGKTVHCLASGQWHAIWYMQLVQWNLVCMARTLARVVVAENTFDIHVRGITEFSINQLVLTVANSVIWLFRVKVFAVYCDSV